MSPCGPSPVDPADLAWGAPVLLAADGLVLREWQQEDLPSMVELFDEPEIARWTPLPSPFTLADAAERLIRAPREGRLLLAITTDGDRPLGEMLLTATGELGYAVGRPYRGQGLAARSLLLLRDHAHEVLGLSVLRLRIDPENAASAATAVRAGFRPRAIADERIVHKGRRITIRTWEHVAAAD